MSGLGPACFSGESHVCEPANVGALSVTYRDHDDVVRHVPLREAARQPLERALPIRRPGFFAAQRRNPGWYWSATTGGLVPHESRLELAHLLLADFDQEVRYIVAQPMRLHWRAEGRACSHVPDFLLTDTGGGRHLLNVTRRGALEQEQVSYRCAVGAAACRRAGWGYRVAVGAPDRRLLANVRLLAGCRRRPWGVERYRESLLAACVEPAPLVEVEARVGETALVRPALLHLLWTGELGVDLDAPLTGRSLAWRREG